ncbi:hypothetical protein DMUE_2539 [Dictyocoela muelleri]|nr:hypothetical protein DMUE_2539 [Dictyocoela muelleri]
MIYNGSIIINDFLEYFENNFILNSKRYPNKNKSIWSINIRIHLNLPYTTNPCEWNHRHLNSKINKKDQPLAKIISILQKEEQRIKLLINSLKSGKTKGNISDKRVINILNNYKYYKNFENLKHYLKYLIYSSLK